MGKMSADDRLDIFDLFARYAWAYDCGDADAYAEVFTSDAVLSDEKGFLAEGRDAIREGIKTYFGLRGANTWQHHNDHLRIEGDGEACTVHSYWAVLEHRAADGGFGVGSLGWYVSHCVKTPDGWRFKSRRFNYDMPSGLPPTMTGSAT